VPANHLDACEVIIRDADYERYLTALLAPVRARPHLFALYAFNYEIAKTAGTVSQPVMGQIRLQWWREAVDEIYAGRARHHDVVRALAETIEAHDLPRMLLDALIDAREQDLDEAPFPDWTSLEAYADATSGHVMRLAARVLGAGTALDSTAREAGIAYALAGFLRAFCFHASRRHLMFPEQALRALSLSQEEVFSGTMGPKVTALFALAAERARDHFALARASRIPRNVLPAVLPAVLVPVYSKILTRADFNPFRDCADVPVYRRQLAMLGAMIRGKL
jgi:phytoene/squalene synthetase